ncbi:MAG TPA: 4-alpha-glucanotransferase [Arenimonas sp.]|nr:4-alpha-glucanotransferase [Arenimonas sp.]
MIDLHQRQAGVLLHITSLPGPNGIGDFGPDAFRFVDWLASAGQRIWQWLPTTPIGPGDSPYQSVSAFAGSPLMVALEPLIESGWLEKPTLPDSTFENLRVNFSQVVPWRLEQLRKAYMGFKQKNNNAEQQIFLEWQKLEESWLNDYALFMALETENNGSGWWLWPEAVKKRESKALSDARVRLSNEFEFWAFIQWCFDTQLAELKKYANEHNVAIMGDLPIFIAQHSSDCWSRPDLYLLDENFQPTAVAGCPPDAMAPTGQRWGNPLYRWDKMAEEDFAWWKARLKRALNHADVFRIDHFRGFAGYFEIPASCPTAEQGQWLPGPGSKLFEAIEQSLGKLPIVAEDLGLITQDVIELRDKFNFPGMKILQFGFGSNENDGFLPHNWGPNFLAYTGTHDNDTVRGWWHNASENERDYAARYLNANADNIHWAMIQASCHSIANTVIFPLQDILGLDGGHRMNVPGTVGPHNWTWRFDWSWIDDNTTESLLLLTNQTGRGVSLP